MKKIILTGGGTAGHVTPNIAMLPRLREMGYEISYIGTYDGIEKKLIEDAGIPYYGISSGKLRRYFSLRNFSDPFRVMKGFRQAKKLMKKLQPDVVFSKGGFVSVPVVLAAERRKIPVVIHESDMTPGLANKIALPKATKICCNFPETAESFPEGVATVTGTPIRQELFNGDPEKAFSFCGFTEKKPTLLVIGGSTGSAAVNAAVWDALDELLKEYNVIHICGQDKMDESKVNAAVWDALDELLKEYNVIHICGQDKMDESKSDLPGYKEFEYVKKELADLFALSDLIISRAGANAICELLALRKPNILIPLSKAQSRGDQILNARSFEKSGYSKVIEEEELTRDTLIEAVHETIREKDRYIDAMSHTKERDAITIITEMIDSLT